MARIERSMTQGLRLSWTASKVHLCLPESNYFWEKLGPLYLYRRWFCWDWSLSRIRKQKQYVIPRDENSEQIGVSIFSEKDLGGKLTSWSETPADHEGDHLCVIQTASKLLVIYPWEALTISGNVFTKMHVRPGMVDTPPLSYPIPSKWCSPGGKGELIPYMNTGEVIEQSYDWLYQLIMGT